MELEFNGRKAKKKQNVQFVATCHLLRHGKPMTHERFVLFFEDFQHPKETIDKFQWVGNNDHIHTYCIFEANYHDCVAS
jgi:hypothetical protein